MQRNNPDPSPKTLKTRIILIVSGLLLSLIVLEAGLRAGGMVLSAIQEYNNRIAVSKRGSYRILCLGESTTARQYPGPLEKTLNNSGIGIRFEVIDKGIVASNTDAILSQLESNLAKYAPDMVVAMIGSNDRGVMFYKDMPDMDTGLLCNLRIYRLARILYSGLLNKSSTKAPHYWTSPVDLYKRAIAVNPRNAQAYVELGIIYRDQGDTLASERCLRKAIEISPRHYSAFIILGEIFYNSGMFLQAEKCFRDAIEINPGNSDAYLGVGEILRHQERWLEAEESLRKAMALNNKSSAAFIALAQIYKSRGDPRRAADVLREYVKYNPAEDFGYKAIDLLYRDLGRKDPAQGRGERLKEDKECEYAPKTIRNYITLRRILKNRGVRLVCVQYPMRSVNPLKRIFGGRDSVLFVDNQKTFREAVQRDGYDEYFIDMFGGDFGHCTARGNKLLAENIAGVILKEVFAR